MLPNLIVIGAMKSATTSLHHYLGLHPDIEMSEEKELHFFVKEKNWSKGLDWYSAQFPAGKPVRGESSPGYTFHPRFTGVAERIHKLIPDAKLIYVLRDPIERMLSHYVHVRHKGLERRPAQQALLDRGRPYLACSQYYMQLEQYLEYFPRENILIITNEDLRDHRRATLQKVFRFLGVDPDFYAEDFERRRHSSEGKSSTSPAGRLLVGAGVRLKRLVPVPASVSRALVGAIRKLTTKPIGKPVLSDRGRAEIAAALAPDVAKLRAFTGRRFEEWSL